MSSATERLIALHQDATSTTTSQVHSVQVHIASQCLKLVLCDGSCRSFSISTSQHGVNNVNGSYGTPEGWHRICAKIGDKAPSGMEFVGRSPTGRIVPPSLSTTPTGVDCITSRILWLDGLEEGYNKGGEVDSKNRYIYIHGTHEEGLIGTPVSHGCIRMTNADVIDLYEKVSVDTRVLITRS